MGLAPRRHVPRRRRPVIILVEGMDSPLALADIPVRVDPRMPDGIVAIIAPGGDLVVLCRP